jgi:hypothetical protein
VPGMLLLLLVTGRVLHYQRALIALHSVWRIGTSRWQRCQIGCLPRMKTKEDCAAWHHTC